jgi:hypothetical protein
LGLLPPFFSCYASWSNWWRFWYLVGSLLACGTSLLGHLLASNFESFASFSLPFFGCFLFMKFGTVSSFSNVQKMHVFRGFWSPNSKDLMQNRQILVGSQNLEWVFHFEVFQMGRAISSLKKILKIPFWVIVPFATNFLDQ